MERTQKYKLAFAERGIVYLENCAPRSKTLLAKECILGELRRLRILEKGKWHNKQFANLQPFQVSTHIGQKLKHQAAFSEVINQELVDYVHELAAGTQLKPQPFPQILVTPPQKGDWSVPYLGWHLDVHAPSREILPGIQLFVLLDDVARHGGGTLAIAGSHRLHMPHGEFASNAHQVLRKDPTYASLFENESNRSIFLQPLCVQGVELQVIEMAGKAGDVYVMDMRILHAPSLNASKNARIMLTQRYLK